MLLSRTFPSEITIDFLLNVYALGHVQVKEGQAVKVTGIYQRVKRVGKYTFHNEIDAASINQE